MATPNPNPRPHFPTPKSRGDDPHAALFQEQLRTLSRTSFNASKERNEDSREYINRARTSSKYCASTPFVADDETLHRSVIQELQCLDCPPTNTQHLIRSKKTLEELFIRKSSSLDREKVEFSLSSEYIDLESENAQLRRRVDDLEEQTRYYIDLQEDLRSQLLASKHRIEELSQKVDRSQSQLMQTRQTINEYQALIANKESQTRQLEDKLTQANQQILQAAKTQGTDISPVERGVKALRAEFEEKTRLLTERHSWEMRKTENEFKMARVVGQEQIDGLVRLLQRKESEYNNLRAAAGKDCLKNSTHISSNLSLSKAASREPQERYVARFTNFARMIDRRLYSSESKSSILSSNAGAQRARLGKNLEHLGRFDEKRSQHLQPCPFPFTAQEVRTE